MARPTTWGSLLVLVTLASGAPAPAQDRSLIETILEAILLPAATQEARVLGVPETDLRTIFTTARERKMPATTIREILVQGNESVREHGPIDNFGAFVQEKLDAGLRGRDLSEAIRAEHARRGIGKGKVPGRADEHPDAQGKNNDRGEKKGGDR